MHPPHEQVTEHFRRSREPRESPTRDQLIRHLRKEHNYDVFGTMDTHGDDLWMSDTKTPIRMLVDAHDDDHAQAEDGSDMTFFTPHTHGGSMGNAPTPTTPPEPPVAELKDAARRVIENWESGDLAGAVSNLAGVLGVEEQPEEEEEEPRWIVTEVTSVTASSEDEAIELVVNNIKGGDQEVIEQSAIDESDFNPGDEHLRIDLSPIALRELFMEDDDDPTSSLTDEQLRAIARSFLGSNVWRDLRYFVRDAS